MRNSLAARVALRDVFVGSLISLQKENQKPKLTFSMKTTEELTLKKKPIELIEQNDTHTHTQTKRQHTTLNKTKWQHTPHSATHNILLYSMRHTTANLKSAHNFFFFSLCRSKEPKNKQRGDPAGGGRIDQTTLFSFSFSCFLFLSSLFFLSYSFFCLFFLSFSSLFTCWIEGHLQGGYAHIGTPLHATQPAKSFSLLSCVCARVCVCVVVFDQESIPFGCNQRTLGSFTKY